MSFKRCYFHFAIAFIIICYFWCRVEGGTRNNTYTIYEVEDHCDNETHIYQLENQTSSTFKLKAYDNVTGRAKTAFCRFNIRPPKGHGVIVHLEYFHLEAPVKEECHFVALEISSSSIKITMCGTEPQGSSVYFEEGEDAECYFFAESPFATHKKFTLVATAYEKACSSPNLYHCTNGKCIWDGLVRDGVNNCGDNSDEIREEPTDSPVQETSNGLTNALPYIIVAISFLLLGILAGVFNRWRKLKANRQHGAMDKRPIIYSTNDPQSSPRIGGLESREQVTMNPTNEWRTEL